jgi:hypothetical protein
MKEHDLRLLAVMLFEQVYSDIRKIVREEIKQAFIQEEIQRTKNRIIEMDYEYAKSVFEITDEQGKFVAWTGTEQQLHDAFHDVNDDWYSLYLRWLKDPYGDERAKKEAKHFFFLNNPHEIEDVNE